MQDDVFRKSLRTRLRDAMPLVLFACVFLWILFEFGPRVPVVRDQVLLCSFLG